MRMQATLLLLLAITTANAANLRRTKESPIQANDAVQPNNVSYATDKDDSPDGIHHRHLRQHHHVTDDGTWDDDDIGNDDGHDTADDDGDDKNPDDDDNFSS